MERLTVRIDKPATANVILGQTHFIKTVEGVHEVFVNAVPVTPSKWGDLRGRSTRKSIIQLP